MTFDELPVDPDFEILVADEDELPTLRKMVIANLGVDVAKIEELQKVLWLSSSLLTVRRAGSLCGGFAGLMLNCEGHTALHAGALRVMAPSAGHLVRYGEPAEAIYVWAIFFPGSAAGNIMKVLKRPEYRSAPLYASLVTPAGRAFMERGGGTPLDGHQSLWVYHRAAC